MVLVKIIDLVNLHYKWACLPPHLVDKGTEVQTGKDPTMTTQILGQTYAQHLPRIPSQSKSCDKSSKDKKKGRPLDGRLISVFVRFARTGPDFTIENGMKGKALPSLRKKVTAVEKWKKSLEKMV